MEYEFSQQELDSLCVAFEQFIDYVKIFVRIASEAVRQFVHSVSGSTEDVLLRIAPISGRVKHLAQHAKKRRVRKKNLNRICRALKKVRRCNGSRRTGNEM